MQRRFEERRFVSPLLAKETSGRMGRRTYSIFSPRIGKVIVPVYQRIVKLLEKHESITKLSNLHEVVTVGKHRVEIELARTHRDEYVGIGNKGILKASFLGKNCFVKIDYLHDSQQIMEGYQKVNEVLTKIRHNVDGFNVRTAQLQLLHDAPKGKFSVCVTEFYLKEEVRLAVDLDEPEKTKGKQAIKKLETLADQ